MPITILVFTIIIYVIKHDKNHKKTLNSKVISLIIETLFTF